MKDLTLELEEIRAMILVVSLAANGTGEAVPTPETVSLALTGIVHRIDQLLDPMSSVLQG